MTLTALGLGGRGDNPTPENSGGIHCSLSVGSGLEAFAETFLSTLSSWRQKAKDFSWVREDTMFLSVAGQSGASQ